MARCALTSLAEALEMLRQYSQLLWYMRETDRPAKKIPDSFDIISSNLQRGACGCTVSIIIVRTYIPSLVSVN